MQNNKRSEQTLLITSKIYKTFFSHKRVCKKKKLQFLHFIHKKSMKSSTSSRESPLLCRSSRSGFLLSFFLHRSFFLLGRSFLTVPASLRSLICHLSFNLLYAINYCSKKNVFVKSYDSFCTFIVLLLCLHIVQNFMFVL